MLLFFYTINGYRFFPVTAVINVDVAETRRLSDNKTKQSKNYTLAPIHKKV